VIAIENTRLFEAEQASKRELRESLEYQTATSEILTVISRSPNDTQPVFDTIARIAALLCKAYFCHAFRFDGQLIHLAASRGLRREAVETLRSNYPMVPGRGSAAARSILSGTIEEIPDIHADADYQHGRRAPFASGLLGFAHSMLKQYDQALQMLRACVARSPTFRSGHVWLAATYVQMGKLEEAYAEAVEVLRIDPQFTIDGTQRRLALFKRPEDAEHLFDGLRKAGLPEK
jgi:tetratricopeptide (TPR) repeat protein